MKPVEIVGCGMVSAVGLDAPSSCAAIRVGISGAEETKFMLGGEWLLGCEVPLRDAWRGREKLKRMAAKAIGECLECVPNLRAEDTACLLVVSERDRPGRPDQIELTLLHDLEEMLQLRFHPASETIAEGRVGAAGAVERAMALLARAEAEFCVIVGVDSLLNSVSLGYYHDQHRLLVSENSDGFIPGEAAAAVLLAANTGSAGALQCLGVGHAHEDAHIMSEELRLQGLGLAAAMRSAVASSGLDFGAIDFRITGDNGEQYGFKEGALALARVLRPVRAEFDIWHPAECIGEVGAATLPAVLVVALAATRKGYSKGPGILCHVGNDDGARSALVLRCGEVRRN